MKILYMLPEKEDSEERPEEIAIEAACVPSHGDHVTFDHVSFVGRYTFRVRQVIWLPFSDRVEVVLG